jgi:hypothetical protein
MTKKFPWIPLGILACLVLAAVAGFWALNLISSLFSYRSPLRLDPPAPGLVLDQPTTHCLVIVLVDALREDTSREAEVMPTLNQLRQQGAWAVMHSQPPSYSEPGYSVLLTGAWPDLSDGPAANLEYEAIYPFTQDNIFSAAHRLGIRTAVSGYYWFEKLIPAEAVDIGFFTAGEDRLADRQAVDAALPWLASGDYGLVLIHLDQVDYAGHHEGGPRDPNWAQAARRSDALIAEIAAHLDFSQDTLMVVSDHGQIEAGGHGGHDPIVLLEPFILAGAGVRPGHYQDVQMVDVAPTAALLLGTNLPASAQGRPLAEMLALDDEQVQTLQMAYETQQTELLSAYTAAIGQPNPPVSQHLLNLTDIQAAYQTALENAQATRLRTERLLRAALAIPIFLGMLFMIWKIPRAQLWWLLVSAMLYVLLFNLRYVLLDSRTYSLSSVSSPTDLILYVGITAWLSLLAAWLVSSYGLGGLRVEGLSSAAGLAILQALVIVAILSLPVLWSFIANGALITWILPDFASSFAALLSLIQILFVCLSAVLIAGVGVLFEAVAQRRARPWVSVQGPG